MNVTSLELLVESYLSIFEGYSETMQQKNLQTKFKLIFPKLSLSGNFIREKRLLVFYSFSISLQSYELIWTLKFIHVSNIPTQWTPYCIILYHTICMKFNNWTSSWRILIRCSGSAIFRHFRHLTLRERLVGAYKLLYSKSRWTIVHNRSVVWDLWVSDSLLFTL